MSHELLNFTLGEQSKKSDNTILTLKETKSTCKKITLTEQVNIKCVNTRGTTRPSSLQYTDTALTKEVQEETI